MFFLAKCPSVLSPFHLNAHEAQFLQVGPDLWDVSSKVKAGILLLRLVPRQSLTFWENRTDLCFATNFQCILAPCWADFG